MRRKQEANTSVESFATPGTLSEAKRDRAMLIALLRPRKRSLVLISITSLAAGLLEAGFLVLITRTAFAISDQTDEVGPVLGRTLSIASAVGLAVVLVVGRVVLGWIATLLSARLTRSVGGEVSRNLACAFLEADWAAQHGDRPGRLQELLTTFAGRSASVISNLASVLSRVLSLVVLLGTAVFVDPAASLVAIAGVLLFSSFLRPLRRAIRRQSKVTTATSMEFATALNEVSDLGMEMNVFGVQPAVSRRVEVLIERREVESERLSIMNGMVPIVYGALAYLAIALALGVISTTDGTRAGAAGAAMLIMLRSLSYGQNLQSAWTSINSSMPFLHVVDEELRRYGAARVRDGGIPIGRLGSLGLEGVSFQYAPGQPVLRDITAVIRPNEIVGIMGPSGSGKSTLVQLLLGLRDPVDGRITAAGRDIRTLSRLEWARRVTFVPQQAHLIAGSVADNIRFFRPDVSDSDVEHAARLAQLHDDVMGFSERYERQVGERGNQLSGGQQQRLIIARALVERPDLLILDEPTSSLDVRSESLIRDTLHALRENMTIIIIAHRLSTLDICDRLMVIQDGELRGFDTPENLELDSAFYREALTLSGLR